MAPTSSAMPGSVSVDPQPQLLQAGDLVASLPAPILRLLVLFARPIALFKRTLEVLSWRSGKRVESWIVVSLWWGICLGAGHAFVYLLPPLVFLPFLPLSRLRLKSTGKSPKPNTLQEPSTSETLLSTVSELNAIYALLPPSPSPTIISIYDRFRQLGPIRLFRGLVVLWITWLALGRIIGYRTLLALLGTIVLLLPSPPLVHLINLLSKSLFVRRGVALAFLFTFGSPPETSYRFSLSVSPLGWAKSKWTDSRRPSLAFSFRPKMSGKIPPGSALVDEKDDTKETVENPIYFRFEVHENQRWWMGLDWTSALFPQERPSWCDLHLQPVSPPPNFTLPASTSIVVPSPTPLDPKARTMRTATWKWLDDDWSIVRAGPGLAANPNPPALSSTVPTPNGEADAEGSSGFSVNPQQHNRPSSFSFGSSPPKQPSMEEQAPSASARAQSIAEQAVTKGLERLKARTASAAASVSTSMSATSPARKSVDYTRARTGSQASDEAYLDEVANSAQIAVHVPTETIVERDAATDVDGWVYGDNKWESMGARGGLGKYTRRRRWQRRAVCVETITRLAAEPTASGVDAAGGDPDTTLTETATGETTPKVPASPASPFKTAPVRAVSDVNAQISRGRTSVDSDRSSIERGWTDEKGKEAVVIPDTYTKGGRDDKLRQRLKKAMGSVGG